MTELPIRMIHTATGTTSSGRVNGLVKICQRHMALYATSQQIMNDGLGRTYSISFVILNHLGQWGRGRGGLRSIMIIWGHTGSNRSPSVNDSNKYNARYQKWVTDIVFTRQSRGTNGRYSWQPAVCNSNAKWSNLSMKLWCVSFKYMISLLKLFWKFQVTICFKILANRTMPHKHIFDVDVSKWGSNPRKHEESPSNYSTMVKYEITLQVCLQNCEKRLLASTFLPVSPHRKFCSH